MALPVAINTTNPLAVAAATKEELAKIGTHENWPRLDRLFSDITRMFRGEYPGLQASDMFYHNFEHTLQATICLVQMLVGRHQLQIAPVLSARDCELAVMAALFHDTGFLKYTGDDTGTGAKYTFVHEQRSVVLARKYLPTLGLTSVEVEEIATAIGCTGPAHRISNATFHRPEAHIIACLLATADYLSQMSAPDYVTKLPILYKEFREAYDFEGLPDEKRMFQNFPDLMDRSPSFWEKFVRPILDTEMGGMYKFLETTGQTNPYMQAIEANIKEVRRRVQDGLGNV